MNVTPEALVEAIGVPHERDVPLGPLTWYGVGGPARVVAHPQSLDEAARLIAECRRSGIRIETLGAGANLLVRSRGVDGVVIRLDAPAFGELTLDGGQVTVGAGHDLAKLILRTASAGLAGLEGLAGIPATLGGAVRMNAGGAFGQIGDAVAALTLIHPDGRLERRTRDRLVFAYRRTNLGPELIAQVELALAPGDPAALREQVKSVMAYKKRTQPMAESSAGCAFKNPAADDSGLPEGAPASAGALIDLAGLKGLRVGGAEVSARHANFIVVHPGAQADDIANLMEAVQAAVARRFGVILEREVVVW